MLVVLLGMEAARFAFDFVKFGRPASYHSYLAKLWGLVMAVAVIGVFALDRVECAGSGGAGAGDFVQCGRAGDVGGAAGVAEGCEDVCGGVEDSQGGDEGWRGVA